MKLSSTRKLDMRYWKNSVWLERLFLLDLVIPPCCLIIEILCFWTLIVRYTCAILYHIITILSHIISSRARVSSVEQRLTCLDISDLKRVNKVTSKTLHNSWTHSQSFERWLARVQRIIDRKKKECKK